MVQTKKYMRTKKLKWGFSKAFGPGLILAAAAIGVSHLVQATRAGADYGFSLVWVIIIACLSKYPFLEFGPRYTKATNESLINGYKKLGNWALWIYIIFTVGTMFALQAAVTIVTASLAVELTSIELPLITWSIIILGICIACLWYGQYASLDYLIKIVMVILTLSTVAAFFTAFFSGQASDLSEAPSVWNVTGVAFLVALMGWMPIPIDAAAWNSLWTLERERQTDYKASLKESLWDFNIGYIGASILAVFFLGLGALVMFGSGISFSASGSEFAKQLVDLYTTSLGSWAHWIIIICAFTTMFSTTLTVTDAYPRVWREILNVVDFKGTETNILLSYKSLMIIIAALSLSAMYLLGSQFTIIVDLATSLSFLTAPALAYINYKAVKSLKDSPEFMPPRWLNYLSIGGLIFLSVFSVLFFYWRFL